MCYIKYMNKDVIYIEPDDDITDIISRVRNAKQKVVALVPPKKIGVLRSAVNTKLVAKAGKGSEKVVVIVTTDPSMIKLAAAAGLPVAKSLQSRPKLPSELTDEELKTTPVTIEEDTPDVAEDAEMAPDLQEAPKRRSRASESAQELSSDEIGLDSENEEKAGRGAKKGQKPTKAEKKAARHEKKANQTKLQKARKWIIFGVIVTAGLIGFFVWAFTVAPAVDIDVAIRTTTSNFSEAVTFTIKPEDANLNEGIFALKPQTMQQDNSVTFQATGTKNVGEKATGKLTLNVTFKYGEDDEFIDEKTGLSALTVPAGTTFAYDQYEYKTTQTAEFVQSEDCKLQVYRTTGCPYSVTVNAEAVAPGEAYNIGAHDSGWATPISIVSAYNKTAFSGGTTQNVTVVQQSDINSAQAQLAVKSEGDGRATLLSKSESDDIIIFESTYSQTSTAPVSSVAVGTEVKEGQELTLSSTTTYTVYAVEKADLIEYINKKTLEKVSQDQKIYENGTPFIERFLPENEGRYTGRLKGTAKVGPTVTEESILEKAKGRKTGELQSLLKSITGVSTVEVKPSFFWVNTIPEDEEKIHVTLKVEE